MHQIVQKANSISIIFPVAVFRLLCTLKTGHE